MADPWVVKTYRHLTTAHSHVYLAVAPTPHLVEGAGRGQGCGRGNTTDAHTSTCPLLVFRMMSEDDVWVFQKVIIVVITECKCLKIPFSFVKGMT